MSDVAEREPKTLVNFPVAGDLFVGRFHIDAVLNRGGFGCVYRATQTDLKRQVAIKVLRPASRVGFNDDSNAEAKRLEVVAKRFEREAQLVSQLRDPHTVMMYEFGQTPDGLLFMVLEYIDGRPLSKVVEEEGAVPVERAVAIVMQVLSSLDEAHARSMLHRDIKPPNIMLYDHLDRRDQVKVLDFGLAKAMDDPVFSADNPDLTDDEVLIGTPRYMSPEQIRGHKLGPATDIYSLGLVFFELLTGEKAVTAKSTMNALARHINEVPIRLPDEFDVDGRIRHVVNRMLEKDIGKRFQSASEVIKELEAWKLEPWAEVEFEEIFEAPAGAAADSRRNWVIGAALLTLFGLVLYFAFSSNSEPQVVTVEVPVVKEVPKVSEEPKTEPVAAAQEALVIAADAGTADSGLEFGDTAEAPQTETTESVVAPVRPVKSEPKTRSTPSTTRSKPKGLKLRTVN